MPEGVGGQVIHPGATSGAKSLTRDGLAVAENTYRCGRRPSLRWFHQKALGRMLKSRHFEYARPCVQGPKSGRLLKNLAERCMRPLVLVSPGLIAVDLEISRTGDKGDWG